MKFLLLLAILSAWADPTEICRTVSGGGVFPVEADVRSYYRQVDAGNIEGALGRFAREARYKRGSTELEDLDQIKEFYRKTRTLKGKHTVSRLDVAGKQVRVEGYFEGESNGKPVKILFTDYWTYDAESNQVIQRTSVLTNENGVPLNL